MDQQKMFFPKGNPTDTFDKDAHGRFQSDLMNLAYDKHLSKERNIFLVGLCGVCVAAVVYIATTANYKTYVVRVNDATGQIEAGQQLQAVTYNPKEAEIKYFLSQFVENIRTVPLDPILYRKNWQNAQQYMTTAAAQKLNGLIASENQAAKLGQYTTSIKIRSVQMQPGSQRTYQVRWSEDTYSIGGTNTGKQDIYVALFTVAIEPPTNEAAFLVNPLGLKIADLNYAKETSNNK